MEQARTSKHIGLIGGIGVAATLVYYPRLVAGLQAAGLRPEITIVHGDAATLLAHNRADDRAAQAAIFASLIDRLASAGADFAAITSLGGHFCFAETEARSALPLISGLSPIDDHLKAAGIGQVGLLGTASAMRSGLYGQLQTPMVTPEDIAVTGRVYEDMALRGHATAEDRAHFLRASDALMGAGAEAVLLVGTDLNLVFDHVELPYPVIDALDIHVARLVAEAGG